MVLRSLILLTFLFSSSILFAFDEEKLAKSLDLDPVIEAHPYNFFGVTSMYANDPMTRQMLVIKDVDAELKETRIVEAKGFLVVEIPKDEKSYSSLAFVGIKEDEIKPLLSASSPVTKFLREISFYSSAFANDTCDVKAPSSFESIEALNKYYQTTYTQDTLRCLNQKLPPSKENMELLKKNSVAFWEKKLKEHSHLLGFISSVSKSEKLCDFFKTLNRSELTAIFSGGLESQKIQKKYEVFILKKP